MPSSLASPFTQLKSDGRIVSTFHRDHTRPSSTLASVALQSCQRPVCREKPQPDPYPSFTRPSVLTSPIADELLKMSAHRDARRTASGRCRSLPQICISLTRGVTTTRLGSRSRRRRYNPFCEPLLSQVDDSVDESVNTKSCGAPGTKEQRFRGCKWTRGLNA